MVGTDFLEKNLNLYVVTVLFLLLDFCAPHIFLDIEKSFIFDAYLMDCN